MLSELPRSFQPNSKTTQQNDRFIPLKVRQTHFHMYEEINEYTSIRNINQNEFSNIIPRRLIENVVLDFGNDQSGQRPIGILKMRANQNQLSEFAPKKIHKKLYSYNTQAINELSTNESPENSNARILDFSKNNFLYLARESNIYGFDFHSNKTFSSYIGSDEIYSISVNNFADNLVALTSTKGECKVVDLKSKIIVKSYKNTNSKDKMVAMDWSYHNLICGTSLGVLSLKDTRTKNEDGIDFSNHKTRISRVKSNSNENSYVISADIDGKICLTDLRKGFVQSFNEHFKSVRDLSWSHKNPSFFSSCGKYDGKILQWSIYSDLPLKRINLDRSVYNVDYIEDGNIIASSGRPDNSISVFDTNAFEKIVDFKGHQASVYHMALNDEKNMAVSCSQDGMIKFWDLKNHLENERKRSKSSRFEHIR